MTARIIPFPVAAAPHPPAAEPGARDARGRTVARGDRVRFVGELFLVGTVVAIVTAARPAAMAMVFTHRGNRIAPVADLVLVERGGDGGGDAA